MFLYNNLKHTHTQREIYYSFNYKLFHVPFCRTGMVTLAVLLPGACVAASLLLQMCASVSCKLGHHTDTNSLPAFLFSKTEQNFQEIFVVVF